MAAHPAVLKAIAVTVSAAHRLAASQLVGLAIARYAVRLDALAADTSA
jgi:hypothetical protein